MEVSHCFKIDVSVQDSMPLIAEKKKTIKNLDCGHWWTIGDPVWIDADPFLFVHNNKLYLFYEDLHFYNYLGVIKMTYTTDLVHWSKPVLITHEPDCHFSYPFVFEDNGEVYMMPETGNQHNIRLYKADNDDLTIFSLHKVIMQREDIPKDIVYDFADSCIYKKDNLYYLLTSTMTNESYYLHLYTSQQLEGPYEMHPSSPVVSNSKFGRCAGSLLEHDGHLYRFAQDCSDAYGKQVHLLEIDEITPTQYTEHVVKENILPSKNIFYAGGGHQVNFAEFNGRVIVATDAKCDRTFVLERIVGKILRLLNVKSRFPKPSGITK